jgi:hypothetical protein
MGSGPAVPSLRTGELFSFPVYPITKIEGRALGGGRCSGERLKGISDRVWDVRPSLVQQPLLADQHTKNLPLFRQLVREPVRQHPRDELRLGVGLIPRVVSHVRIL